MYNESSLMRVVEFIKTNNFDEYNRLLCLTILIDSKGLSCEMVTFHIGFSHTNFVSKPTFMTHFLVILSELNKFCLPKSKVLLTEINNIFYISNISKLIWSDYITKTVSGQNTLNSNFFYYYYSKWYIIHKQKITPKVCMDMGSDIYRRLIVPTRIVYEYFGPTRIA